MDASTEFCCGLGKLSSKPPSAEGENRILTYSGLFMTEANSHQLMWKNSCLGDSDVAHRAKGELTASGRTGTRGGPRFPDPGMPPVLPRSLAFSMSSELGTVAIHRFRACILALLLKSKGRASRLQLERAGKGP